MITKEHIPQPYHWDWFAITGDDIDELIEYCLLLIRPQSRAYYSKTLMTCLTNNGFDIIDRHAGNGTGYDVILKRQGERK
jgi:hypothetical protein